jgi:hypothetical protein
LNTDRIDPQFTEAHEAVVTYSRVPPRTRARGLAVVERVEPRLDAAEVPLIDPHDDVDAAFAAPRPEVRAEAIDAALAEKGRRGGSMRVVVLGAAFAMLAGVGVLAGTIGIATIIPGGSPADGGPAAETPLRLTSADAAPDVSEAPADVREIPLAAGEEAPAAEAVAAIAPPLPRPRPEVKTASLEPEAALLVPRATASTETEVAKTAPDPKPAETTPEVATLPPPAQPQGTDALITSIEATLEKIDSVPAGAATANVAAAPPAVLPPPPLEPLASAPPPVYPPVDEGCPPPGTGFDPCYDVMPPEPLTDNGYYQAGPVPPESVPYPYPPQSSDSPATFADGSTSLGDAPESTTGRRPGVVRRAITMTADAVGRVFSRDRGDD